MRTHEPVGCPRMSCSHRLPRLAPITEAAMWDLITEALMEKA